MGLFYWEADLNINIRGVEHTQPGTSRNHLEKSSQEGFFIIYKEIGQKIFLSFL